jgi:hypothetical protein
MVTATAFSFFFLFFFFFFLAAPVWSPSVFSSSLPDSSGFSAFSGCGSIFCSFVSSRRGSCSGLVFFFFFLFFFFLASSARAGCSMGSSLGMGSYRTGVASTILENLK